MQSCSCLCLRLFIAVPPCVRLRRRIRSGLPSHASICLCRFEVRSGSSLPTHTDCTTKATTLSIPSRPSPAFARLSTSSHWIIPPAPSPPSRTSAPFSFFSARTAPSYYFRLIDAPGPARFDLRRCHFQHPLVLAIIYCWASRCAFCSVLFVYTPLGLRLGSARFLFFFLSFFLSFVPSFRFVSFSRPHA